MSEGDSLSEEIGNKIVVFLSNNFKYEGELLAVDADFIKINDEKSNSVKIISKDSIVDISIRNKGDKNGV